MYPFIPSIYPSIHSSDEAERSLHDALCVLTETIKGTYSAQSWFVTFWLLMTCNDDNHWHITETRVVCGGGCMEMLMANAIDKQIPSTAGNWFFHITWLSSYHHLHHYRHHHHHLHHDRHHQHYHYHHDHHHLCHHISILIIIIYLSSSSLQVRLP
jgi:hypothetical protein